MNLACRYSHSLPSGRGREGLGLGKGSVSLLLCPPQSDAELEQGGQEDAEREEQAEHHRGVVAVEEIDELAVVHLRQHVEHDEGHRVVDPVESHTGNDGVGAVVHPA
jgi:hypothetical protein